jgi:ABC-type transport system substrate-binding protein
MGIHTNRQADWRWLVLLSSAAIAVASVLVLSGGAHAAETPFVYAEAFPFSTMDPATAGLNPDMLVAQNTYDALTRYNEKAPSKILPALATSWTQKGKVWTFHIRKGVKFHDGASLTANDVKVSIDRMIKVGQGLAYLLYNVTRVKVVNASTITIACKTANPWLPANLVKVGIVSAKDVQTHASGSDLAQAWFKDHENGTGAYQVSKFTPGTELVLKRNTTWWGKFSAHPVDTFIDKFVVDGNQRFIGLKGGDYQLAAFISTENALSLDKSKFRLVRGHNLWAYPNLNFSTTQAPMNNSRFRAAMVAAFDYKAMVAYYKGFASTSNGPIPNWVPGSPSKRFATIQQNLTKAKALLKASGVKNTTFTCLIPPGSPDYPFVGQILQASAQQIGVRVNLKTVPIAQIPTLMKADKGPCAVYGEASNSPDPIPFFSARYIPGSFANLYNFKSAKLLKLMTQYSAASTAARRQALLAQMSKIVVDSHMDLWTVSPESVVPMAKSVSGYQVDPFNLINVNIASLDYQP